MTVVGFLAFLFAVLCVLCVLAAFYAGVVWRDGKSMARSTDRETAKHG